MLIEEPRVVAEIEAVPVRAHIVAGGGGKGTSFSSFLALFRVADSLLFGRFSESPIRSGSLNSPIPPLKGEA